MEWVSVEERLPEEKRKYLCWLVDDMEQGYDEPWIEALEYSPTRTKAFGKGWDTTDFDRVTHWMELPEPPQ